MKRRDFIGLLGGAAAVWPLAARAQQPAIPVVALLTNGSFEGFAGRLRGFSQGLNETRFVEGRNLAIEFHQAEGDDDRLSALAAQLVQRRVSVIVTNSIATKAAKAATSTIPIVFFTGADPVEMGWVASLNRPSGNLTGITSLGDSLGPKRLELLHEMAPAATGIGVLVNPTNASNEYQLRDLQAAAGRLGLQLHVLNASAQQDFDTVFGTLVGLRAGGLVIATAPIFNNYSEKLAALALQHAIPAIYQYRDFVAGGGLMSLGSDPAEEYRWLGVYAGRILNGEKPSELPVQQATKVQLTINLKTAKSLGLTVPLTLLGRADEVIE
jgi:putative tryptophan/tyrosine transport system substrate-binding protein